MPTTSKNIFERLGFAPEEAANLHARSKLLVEITTRLAPRNLTQKEGAKFLSISQPRFNDLVKNKINNFSLDALVIFLSKLGGTIDVVETNRPTEKVIQHPFPPSNRSIGGFVFAFAKNNNNVTTSGAGLAFYMVAAEDTGRRIVRSREIDATPSRALLPQ